MLHDAPRNSAFRGALETAITAFTKEQKAAPLVLDIGTGSGLLSMLAVRAGASKGMYVWCAWMDVVALAAHCVCC